MVSKKISYLIVIILAIFVSVVLFFDLENNEGVLPESGLLNGTVRLTTGDCMPVACGPEGCPLRSCFSGGISTTIYIREIATSSNMDYSYLKEENKSKLIATLISNSDGTFKYDLPVGEYSAFVEDVGREYCNWNDGESRACAFKIKNGEITEVRFSIDHSTN